jgi:hypothetical protein
MNQQDLLDAFVSTFNAQKEISDGTRFRLRCPICNDHPTRMSKKSAGLWMQNGQYMFQCFRCHSKMSLIAFAKSQMPSEYIAVSNEFCRRKSLENIDQIYLAMKENNPFQR